MSQTIVTLPAAASVDDVVEVLERDGGVIVEDMLSEDVLSRLWADMAPFLDRTPFGEKGFTGAFTRRCSALFAKSPVTAELALQPHFHGAAERILREDFELRTDVQDGPIVCPTPMQISVTTAIQIWPGQPAQPLHRDDSLHHRVHPCPESQVQVLYAGTEFTAEVGATMVIPGSHRWDNQRRPRREEAIPAEMKRGSGLMYVGSLYHGGGANITADRTRTAFTISYCRSYLRQEENQYLVVPIAKVKQYPPQIQALLGYAACPPLCGWVEMQEPSIVLSGDDFTVRQAMNLV